MSSTKDDNGPKLAQLIQSHEGQNPENKQHYGRWAKDAKSFLVQKFGGVVTNLINGPYVKTPLTAGSNEEEKYENKRNIEERIKVDENRSKLFECILQYLSELSRHAVENFVYTEDPSASKPSPTSITYAEIHRNYSVHELWLFIKITHEVGNISQRALVMSLYLGLLKTRMTDGGDVNEFLRKLSVQCSNLKNIHPDTDEHFLTSVVLASLTSTYQQFVQDEFVRKESSSDDVSSLVTRIIAWTNNLNFAAKLTGGTGSSPAANNVSVGNPDVTCKWCSCRGFSGKGHRTDDCRWFSTFCAEQRETVKAEKAAKQDKKGGGKKFAPATPSADAKKPAKRPAKETINSTTAAEHASDSDGEVFSLVAISHQEARAFNSSTHLGDEGAVYLDSCATDNVTNDLSMLTNTRSVHVSLMGQGGASNIKKAGSFPILGHTLFNPKSDRTIWSQRKLLKTCDLVYDSKAGDYYTVINKTTGNSIRFDVNDRGLYVCNFGKNGTPPVVCNAEIKEELPDPIEDLPVIKGKRVDLAYKARELHINLNHPSTEVLCRALDSGVVVGTSVNSQDVRNSNTLLGKCPGCLAGKASVSRPLQQIHNNMVAHRLGQYVCMDILYVHKEPLLIATDTFNGDMFDAQLPKGKSARELVKGMALLNSRFNKNGISVENLITDDEAVLTCPEFETWCGEKGITNLPQPPGTHAPAAERKARIIRERARCICSTLSYVLPRRLHMYLVREIIQSLRIMPNLKTGNTSPYNMVSEAGKIDVGITYGFRFGAIVTCHVPNLEPGSDDRMKDRQSTGIVVGRSLDVRGKLYVFDLISKEVVDRSAATCVLTTMTDTIHEAINAISKNDPIFAIDDICRIDSRFTALEPALTIGDMILARSEWNRPTTAHRKDDEAVLRSEDNLKSVFEQTAPISNPTPVENSKADNTPTPTYAETTASTPIKERAVAPLKKAVPTVKPLQFMEKVQLMQSARPSREERLAARNKAKAEVNNNISLNKLLNSTTGKESVEKEINQFMNLKVGKPVKREDLSLDDQRRVIDYMMFGKEKTNMYGEEILKARGVARGDQQDRAEFGDISAGGARPESVNINIAIAAHQNRKMATADVVGAYLKAGVNLNDRDFEKPTIIRVTGALAKLFVKLYPHLKTYLSDKGELIMMLDKALYGLLQSALCWYRVIAKTLLEDGFKLSKYDPCLFSKNFGGVQTLINMGVNMGMLPTKGLTLPLLSFGGSAIAATCVAIAILLRIDWENRSMMRGTKV